MWTVTGYFLTLWRHQWCDWWRHRFSNSLFLILQWNEKFCAWAYICIGKSCRNALNKETETAIGLKKAFLAESGVWHRTWFMAALQFLDRHWHTGPPYGGCIQFHRGARVCLLLHRQAWPSENLFPPLVIFEKQWFFSKKKKTCEKMDKTCRKHTPLRFSSIFETLLRRVIHQMDDVVIFIIKEYNEMAFSHKKITTP